MLKMLSYAALGLSLVCASSTASYASENVAIGGACTDVGVSVMTTNQQDVAICLKNTSGALVWKSMANSSGAPCGGTLSGTSWLGGNGGSIYVPAVAGCGTYLFFDTLYQCQNGNVVTLGQVLTSSYTASCT